jgi:hypothetical protein
MFKKSFHLRQHIIQFSAKARKCIKYLGILVCGKIVWNEREIVCKKNIYMVCNRWNIIGTTLEKVV